MAYPNYFNGYYGAAPDMLGQYKSPYQQPMMQPTQQSDPLLWVLNENEATSYPVAPSSSVVLWDKNKPTIYVKTVNPQGIPSMRILDFVERTENSSTTHEWKCGGKYVAIEEFDDFKAKFEELSAKVDGMKPKTKKAEAE